MHPGTGDLISRRRLAAGPEDVAFNGYRAGTEANTSPVGLIKARRPS
ncbi:hypothetical protein [Streptomyces sp. NPDC005262]